MFHKLDMLHSNSKTTRLIIFINHILRCTRWIDMTISEPSEFSAGAIELMHPIGPMSGRCNMIAKAV